MSGASASNEEASDERALLRLLLAALADARAPLPPASDAVLAVARRHRLSPALSALRAGALPAGLTAKCRQDHLGTVARNLVFAHVAAECIQSLGQAGVPVIVLKGLAYEVTIYPQAGLRPTSDVDLLVPEHQRRRAFDVLDRLGFEPRAAAPGFDDADYHEVAWTRAGVEVDLHMALAPLARCDIDYGEIWADAREAVVGGVPARVLHPRHAGAFQALHMAIDHFDVPGIALLDFSRLLPGTEELAAAEATARSWRCHRPFATALALTGAFIPGWPVGPAPAPPPWFARGVVESYGRGGRLPRARQLARKMAHFDRIADAARYVVVQGRRNAHELIERRIRHRSARERLALDGQR